MANYKQSATAQMVAADLALRTSLAAVVDESGTDPVINLGTIGAGSVGFKIKILDQRQGVDEGWDALPGFGAVQQPVYTGGVAQVAFELGAAGEIVGTFDHLLPITGDLVKRGMRVEWYSTANGVAPTWTTLQGSFEPNLYWPLQGRV